MKDERFTLCFTSPPYKNQRTYNLAPFDWHSLMCGAFDRIIEHGTLNCHILINLSLSHKKRQVDMYWLEWLAYCVSAGWPLFGWYIWDKCESLPGEWSGRLAPSHEFLFHFNQKRKYPNKWIATKYTEQSRQREHKTALRKPDDCVHRVSSPDTYGQAYKIPESVIRLHPQKARDYFTRQHPATFPVALPEFIMQTWSQPGDIVYEPFCGSGTSLIAAENLQRHCYAMELSPDYCQLAIERWQALTGQCAELRGEL